MHILARLQILISLYTFCGMVYSIAVNPFKSDEKIALFIFISFLIELPRIYCGWLCYKWIKKDSRATRKGVVKSMLVWFFIDLLLAFHHLVINKALFATFYKGYIYQKRMDLGSANPKGIHNVAQKSKANHVYQDIVEIERMEVYARFLIWAPMKLYFWYVAVRFEKKFGLLDDANSQ